MKAVQIGILVALVLCAGLLFKIYRGQQAALAPPAAVPAQNPATMTPTAATPAPPAPAPAAVQQPAPEPEKPAAPLRKPSPTRAPKKKAPEMVAQNQPPAEPAPAAPAPAPPPPPPPPPAPEPQPQAAPPAPTVPNPPSGAETAPPPPRTPNTVTIPAGTLLSVRLGETLSSDKDQPGYAFPATLDQPLVVDGFVIGERGARVQGKVLESEKAGRVTGVSSLTVHLTRLHTSDGQDIAIETELFRKEGPSSKGEDLRKVGVGAAIGAAIGAMAGGGKGAAIGAGVGGAAGAGTAAATRGKPAELPVETHLTFRLQQPVTLTERLR